MCAMRSSWKVQVGSQIASKAWARLYLPPNVMEKSLGRTPSVHYFVTASHKLDIDHLPKGI